MLWILNLILLVLVLGVSVGVVLMKDLLKATIVLSGQGLLMALLWTRLGAPDLALIYVAMVVSVSTVMLIVAVNRTREGDEER